MHKLTRRDFLRLGAGAAIAAGAPAILAGCEDEQEAPETTADYGADFEASPRSAATTCTR